MSEEQTKDDQVYLDLLKRYWGYDHFRSIQLDIIKSICAGHDTLGLMPTGGGKSITFQVPALAQEGVCIVITPLIALMKDQVSHLKVKGIQAAAIYTGMSHTDVLKTLENAVFGGVKLLYVSPERLSSELFLAKLKHIKVSFITVDEAHCISQWGYDFRPSYLQIANIRELLPGTPVLALTATATPQVVGDIQEKLHFAKRNVFKMSFERKNLSYVVRDTLDPLEEMAHILNSVPGSAIVYVSTRKTCSQVSGWLEDRGFSSTFYHAGLEPSEKDLRQKQWSDNEKRVMVATTAFGMGIDKPDVRLVIHYDCPTSIEAYFQEAGRAGRDGQRSYAVLLWNGSRRKTLLKKINQTYPPKEYIKEVYEHLAYFFTIALGSGGGHTFAFDIDKFCYYHNFYPVTANSALRLLDSAGYIDYEMDPHSRSRVYFTLKRNDLYRINDVSPMEEKVITTILRNYPGGFVNYIFIDLGLIARLARLTKDQVYQSLKSLDHKNILNFIPERKSPLITYKRDRVLPEDLVIPPEVYEIRKDQFTKQIEAMIAYASNKDFCRSRLLLRYFGEIENHDCGHCDVCIDNRPLKKDHSLDAVDTILNILGDHQRHPFAKLRQLPFPPDVIRESIRYLAQEELVRIEGLDIFLTE
jgi:ATP-dependent DNA helicase RecQ